MARKPITTPRGVAVWPHLHAPDTKFDQAGVYSTKIELERNGETEAFLAELERLNDEAFEEARKENPGKKITKRDLYEETESGTVILSVKMKASGVTRKGKPFTQRPALFDATGKPVPAGLRIGGGSIIRVAIEPFPYYMASTRQAGISLRLKAVQVIELREFGANPEYYGFDEEEGFDVSSVEEAPEAMSRPVLEEDAVEAVARGVSETDDF